MMRRSMTAGLIVGLLAWATAGAVLAQEAADAESPELERIELPEVGIALSLPADWDVYEQMVREEAVLPPEMGEAGPAVVWVAMEAYAPTGEGCWLGMYEAHPMSFDEHADWITTDFSENPEGISAFEASPVNLPLGPAYRFDITFEEGAHGTSYLFESGEARYQLRCIDEQRHEDEWLAVVETVEYVPLVPVQLTEPGTSGLEGGVDLVRDFPTTVSVVDPNTPDFPLASLMNADCTFTLWIEGEDGSGDEYLACTLNDEPVEPAEYQGVRPEGVVTDSGGECTWRSDYWYETQREQVMASAFEITVTPSGQVYAHSTYPAEPLECPGL